MPNIRVTGWVRIEVDRVMEVEETPDDLSAETAWNEAVQERWDAGDLADHKITWFETDEEVDE